MCHGSGSWKTKALAVPISNVPDSSGFATLPRRDSCTRCWYYFHYVRDPWGSYSEYSCDMDYIPAGEPWQAGDHDAEDAFYVWGPQPPADWTHNHEADRR